MKIYIPAAALFALAACGSPPAQNDIANNVQDVAANNMAADEVTEVEDDSAAAPTETATPAQVQNARQGHKDEELAKKDRGEQ